VDQFWGPLDSWWTTLVVALVVADCMPAKR